MGSDWLPTRAYQSHNYREILLEARHLRPEASHPPCNPPVKGTLWAMFGLVVRIAGGRTKKNRYLPPPSPGTWEPRSALYFDQVQVTHGQPSRIQARRKMGVQGPRNPSRSSCGTTVFHSGSRLASQPKVAPVRHWLSLTVAPPNFS